MTDLINLENVNLTACRITDASLEPFKQFVTKLDQPRKIHLEFKLQDIKRPQLANFKKEVKEVLHQKDEEGKLLPRAHITIKY